MRSPEYPIRVPLPENTDSLRQSAGPGTEIFDAIQAHVLLGDWHLNWTLQQQIRISRDPELFEFIPLKKRRPEDIELPTGLPVAQQAARYVLSFSERMINAAVDVPFIDIQTKRARNEEGLVTCYDVGVGVGFVPMVVGHLERLEAYDEMEGIDDEAVETILRQYGEYPPQVIQDAVRAHTARFTRESGETGIYVPEFVVAGARHGQELFTNIYDGLMRI